MTVAEVGENKLASINHNFKNFARVLQKISHNHSKNLKDVGTSAEKLRDFIIYFSKTRSKDDIEKLEFMYEIDRLFFFEEKRERLAFLDQLAVPANSQLAKNKQAVRDEVQKDTLEKSRKKFIQFYSRHNKKY